MSSLIPEQRPDKNGNVVTRWVRGMFGKPKRDTAPIPKVTLRDGKPSKPAPVLSNIEAEAVYGRLMGQIETYLPTTGKVMVNIADQQLIREVREKREYNALVLMERFGKTHGYRCVRMAASFMKEERLEGELPGITGQQFDAFKSFSDVAMETSMQHPDENGKSVDHLKIAPVFCHVLMHPEDGPRLERIVSGGVFDSDMAFEMLEQIEDGQVLEVLSEGFL